VLMPTGLYGSLLGAYLGVLAVQGALRQLSAAAEATQGVRQGCERTAAAAAAGEGVTAKEVETSGSRTHQASDGSSQEQQQVQQQKRRPWWAFWNRNRKQQELQSAGTRSFGRLAAEPAQDSSSSSSSSRGEGGSVAVAVLGTDGTAGLVMDDGPETPDNKKQQQQQQQQQESPTTPPAAAAAAPAAATPLPRSTSTGSSSSSSSGVKQAVHNPPGSPSADEGMDAAHLAEHLHQQRLRLRHLEPPSPAATAANGPLAAGAIVSSSVQLLPQLRVTQSLSPDCSRRNSSTAAADGDDAHPGCLPFGEAVALRSVKSCGIYGTPLEAATPEEYQQTPLEAGGSSSVSPRDGDVDSSLSQHSLVGRLSSIFSAAPFGPPVFSRLPSGRGICKITAAAAAAEELQQQQRLRQQRSIDLHNIGQQQQTGDGGQLGLQQSWSAGGADGGDGLGRPDASDKTAAAAAAAATGSFDRQQQQQWDNDDIVDRYLKKHKSLDLSTHMSGSN
jgi:hypothetical protein